MRHEWIDAVMESSLPAPAKHICHALYHRASTNDIRPSVSTIMRDTSLSERTVSRHLVTLEKAGWLSVRRGKGRVNRYTLAQPNPRHSDGTVRVTPPSERRDTPVTVAANPRQSGSLTTPRTTKTPNGAHSDLVKRLFDVGVGILVDAGCTDRNARSLIGRLRKTRGDGGALDAIRAATDKTDPQSWIAACGNPHRKTKGELRRERFDEEGRRWLENVERAIAERRSGSSGESDRPLVFPVR